MASLHPKLQKFNSEVYGLFFYEVRGLILNCRSADGL